MHIVARDVSPGHVQANRALRQDAIRPCRTEILQSALTLPCACDAGLERMLDHIKGDA